MSEMIVFPTFYDLLTDHIIKQAIKLQEEKKNQEMPEEKDES